MALIPPFFFNCVVALGRREPYGDLEWIGTGTLIGRFFQACSETQNQYHIFIVTNKHVLENNESLVIRFNPLNAPAAKDFSIPLHHQVTGKPLWKSHPNDELDIAAIGINADFLITEEVRYDFFQSDNHVLNLDQLSEQGVSEGDFVYVLGFPMGIMAPERQYVIARSGIIARIRDTLEKRGHDFLIDAMVFPGNSGSPVISKPEIISIQGTPSLPKPCLIGIVVSYLTYKDTALSQQTGQPRVIFEENSGLAVVVPMEYVLETVEAAFRTAPIKETPLVEGPVESQV